MSVPTYQQVVEGAIRVLAAAHPEVTFLDYEPKDVYPPTIYTVLAEVRPEKKGQLKQTTYRLLHRLCLRWQDNETAEHELMPYVDSIPLAFENDPWLDGTLKSGLATIKEIFADYVLINGKQCRVLDCYSEILVKG